MMHMIQALGAAKRHTFLGHGNLIHIRRIHNGNRRDRFRFGRCRGVLLHTFRQPFRKSAQQPTCDEVDDGGNNQRLQNIEVHRTKSA